MSRTHVFSALHDPEQIYVAWTFKPSRVCYQKDIIYRDWVGAGTKNLNWWGWATEFECQKPTKSPRKGRKAKYTRHLATSIASDIMDCGRDARIYTLILTKVQSSTDVSWVSRKGFNIFLTKTRGKVSKPAEEGIFFPIQCLCWLLSTMRSSAGTDR